MQDLWIVPARRDRRGPPEPGNRYGTTFRMWDAALGAWRIRWVNPVSGSENTLVARRVGADIVQTGADASGRLLRWIFEAIQPNSFHWRGDISEDGGRTWTCQVEFFARQFFLLEPPSEARAPALDRREGFLENDLKGRQLAFDV